VTGKNGRILFDRPKPTVGSSASGRRRRNAQLVETVSNNITSDMYNEPTDVT
jgi:hypothetical protein